ncbi:MAG: glutathione S-transferase [Gammaproteobacteria bacterium]|nr:glutathione S-transferase [Gammaproteobacteria bacterium]MBU1508045.1 glutathione S-transferase [Gammaproteobacteria bacterium]MBU2120964.1 glutathione S-transferase [Gammaproteobacteria bacterium]MBU2200182.1 glutathione S-transferase [Gammaproteobacteria bacterium]MBU2275497.1 glutathione S-transferase [Gammaproteobacteria bacterium]
MSAALPVLYSFRRCPYAMRARLALAVSGQVCELREVVLRNKPQGLLQSSPKATVPVLVLSDGRVLEQSLDIMRWALAQHDPARWLEPSEGTEADMLALIADCDGHFKQALDRCKYPSRYPDADAPAARKQAVEWLQSLDLRLAQHPFLFGDHVALADMAIAPFVRQFAGIDSTWWDAQPWPHLQAWLAQWQASSLFESVMHKLPAWVDGTEGVSFPVREDATG